MPRIRILKPNVTQEEATALLSPRGLSASWRNFVFGPLRSVAKFYIPFRIFQVEILNRGITTLHIFGLDAVTGALDLYTWEALPDESETSLLDTRNRLPVTLPEEDTQRRVTDKVRRLIFSQGFFRISNFRITAEAVPGEIYIPYWAAFRGHGLRANLSVLDAVRRRMEGSRVREMLRNWLTSVHESEP
ncbi:MAG TPA: hypothetical protein VGF44_17110 [Terriglobales bacterium]|jgi:hypothetical protein